MNEQKNVQRFDAAVLMSLPEMSGELRQGWIDNPVALRDFLSGLCPPATKFQLVAKIDRDMTGWTCLEPVGAEEGEFEPTLCEFLREGENSINGEEMIRRAKEQGVLTGLRHAEAMLRNQERIPVEWRKHYLVFPEVWQGPGGGRNVFYLYWGGRRWYLVCGWLGDDFYSRSRLVGSRKLTQLNSPKG